MKPKLPMMSQQDYLAIRGNIKEFEQKVWFRSLKDYVNSHDERGHRIDIEHFTVLLFSLAGRTMITIYDADENWLTVIVATDQDSPSMGLHERSVQTETLQEWLEFVTKNWQTPSPEPEVTMDVIAYTQQRKRPAS